MSLLLAQETARQVVIQGSPLWVSFLAPAATVVTTLLSLAAAYLLGRAQTKVQLRYEESAKAAVELDRRVYEIYRILRRFEGRKSTPTKEESIELINTLWDEIDELQSYLARSAIWLERDILIEALRIGDSLKDLKGKLSDRVKSEEQKSPPEVVVEAVREWLGDFELRRKMLSKELQKLLGTGDTYLSRLRLRWRRRTN